MTREPIEVTRQDRIYCLKANSDYHLEVCEECKFYSNCDHMTQDDMTEHTIKDLEVLEQEPNTGHWITTRTFMHDGEFYCDKCKCESPNNEKWDYCPNCEAIMIKPQKRSE